eukprot:gene27279-biopygen17794
MRFDSIVVRIGSFDSSSIPVANPLL